MLCDNIQAKFCCCWLFLTKYWTKRKMHFWLKSDSICHYRQHSHCNKSRAIIQIWTESTLITAQWMKWHKQFSCQLHVQGICDSWLHGEKACSNLWYELSCSLCIIFYSSLMWQWLDTENLLPYSSQTYKASDRKAHWFSESFTAMFGAIRVYSTARS